LWIAVESRKAAAMADPRLIDVTLDERTVPTRSADVEQERRVAIADLVAANRFQPQRPAADGYAGPYRLHLSVPEGRLALAVRRADGSPLETIVLGLARFRRVVRDYFAICDSYRQALGAATPQQLETIDMARRATHNEAADLLMERLHGKVAVDFDTARRLFTLICVLHIRS
jgi:uncharacterized protein (UPF0262 family)